MGADSTFVAFRDAFDALRRVSWLSTAGVAPGARPVIAALRAACDAWADGTFDWMAWEAEAECVRQSVAALIGVRPTSIALLSTLAEAATTVAASQCWSPFRSATRPRVLIPAIEFRSNLFPWLALAENGWEPVLLEPGPDGLIRTDAIIAAIRPGVHLVALSEVQSATGQRVDVAAIAHRCHAIGAQLFVNLTQSLGVLQFDAVATHVDYAAVHGYKWLLSPRGTTCLYVRPDHLTELVPLAPNWKNASDLHRNGSAGQPGAYAQLYGGPFRLATDARRLDASLAWLPWVGARAALDLLATIPPDARETHALELARSFRAGARALGLRVVPEDLPTHLVAIDYATPAHATTASQHLTHRGVVGSARGPRLRFGFHAFNNGADVERALCALAESP